MSATTTTTAAATSAAATTTATTTATATTAAATFDTVLIANRGEIARRVARTCREMGLRVVAVFSETDRGALFVREADEAVCIGPGPAAQSYLRGDKVIAAAATMGAGAIHPGYGFLAENAEFARDCAAAGLVFIGPSPEAIEAMGSKIAAKRLMAARGVPVIPGFDGGDDDSSGGDDRFIAAAAAMGMPVLVKASAGGGGKGMRIVRELEALPEALASARREAASSFGDATLLLERYIESPRHVEFQIIGDTQGTLIHCFERECSVQRRHQKIIEEAPSPALRGDDALRRAMGEAAVKAGEAIGYHSAGTVEFILAPDGQFYFLEVNARLQVEHPVTEAVLGIDLVRLQLEVALGQPLSVSQEDLIVHGHAIEARIYAEDPAKDFLPATGTLHAWRLPEGAGIRVDTGVSAGDAVPIHYDPMLAKVTAWGPDRAEATRLLRRVLSDAVILGATTNTAFLADALGTEAWAKGALSTDFVAKEMATWRAPRVDRAWRWRACVAATIDEIIGRDTTRALLPGLPRGFSNNALGLQFALWQVPIENNHSSEDGEASNNQDGEASNNQDGEDDVIKVAYRSVGLRALDVVAAGGAAGPFIRVTWDDTSAVTFGDHRIPMIRQAGDHGGEVWVHHGGRSARLIRQARFPEATRVKDAGGCVAPMPGKVIAVRVGDGQPVAEGDVLVVLEAMKMEHALVADEAGVVEAVLVGEGDVVAAGQALVVVAASSV